MREQVRAAFVGPGQNVVEVSRGQDVRAAVAEHMPDLLVLDLQISNMGGIAVAIDLRLEESAGRLPAVPILLLLDREADRFLAKRADVDDELVKPFDAGTLRRAARRAARRRRPTTQPSRRSSAFPLGRQPVADLEALGEPELLELPHVELERRPLASELGRRARSRRRPDAPR